MYENQVSNVVPYNEKSYPISSHVECSDDIHTTNLPNNNKMLPIFVIGAQVEEDLMPPVVSAAVRKQHTVASLTEANEISAFFPLATNNSQEQEYVRNDFKAQFLKSTGGEREHWKVEACTGGRVFSTATGEGVFIPTLNFASSTTECSGDNFNKNTLQNGNALKGVLEMKIKYCRRIYIFVYTPNKEVPLIFYF